jgi:hypothetical protein
MTISAEGSTLSVLSVFPSAVHAQSSAVRSLAPAAQPLRTTSGTEKIYGLAATR